MIKFETFEQKKTSIDFQNHQDGLSCYLEEKLLPAISEGDWNTLEGMVVVRNKHEKDVLFSNDTWDLNLLEGIKENGPKKIYFTVTENKTDNALGLGKKLERNICNQIKSVALILLYQGKEYGYSTVRQTIKRLIKFAEIMLGNGFNDFGQLDRESIDMMVERYDFFSVIKNNTSLNMLPNLSEYASFEIRFDKLRAKSTSLQITPHEQHFVIPPRIYNLMLNQFTAEINALIPHIEELQSEIKRALSVEKLFVEYKLKPLREGKVAIEDVFIDKSAKIKKSGNNSVNWPEIVKQAFEDSGIKLVDNCQDPRWMVLLHELKPGLISSSTDYQNDKLSNRLSINGKEFESIGELKKYLLGLEAKCRSVCLMLSGMRCDELDSMDAGSSDQTETVRGQKIYLFRSRQSKITKGTQTKEDVFVTTKNGHNAFRLLHAIHQPYLKALNADSKPKFCSLSRTRYPIESSKEVWMSSQRRWLNSDALEIDLTLTAEDMTYINMSNPEQVKFNKGSLFKFTMHQFRRSFAYYVVGFELMAFPQLKQQLSHLSLAMTRHYANNASTFHKLQKEIGVERTRQQSEILARVYQCIANKERIAGGKGKSLMQIAGEGTNYFSIDENKRKMEPEYWQHLIENGKTHLHAIAPGMYCTNSACSMRINIELAECVDCEFDLIDNVLYAEGVRMNAMKNLLLLEETGELTTNIMSQLAMKIKSCERIMSDLEYEFEPFQFSDKVQNTLIGAVNL